MLERENKNKSAGNNSMINLFAALKSVRARKKYSNSRIAKTGFTLVELAVVLVIIGLLIGSIMVGQDLIFAAKVRAQIKQVEEIETAYNTFKVKYNCTAGDCPNATAFFGTVVSTTPLRYVVDGNGDGIICGTWGIYGAQTIANCIQADVTGDVAQLLLHLNMAGLAHYTADGNNDQAVGHTAVIAAIGITFPAVTFGNGKGFYISNLNTNVWTTYMPQMFKTGNIIVIGAGDGEQAIGDDIGIAAKPPNNAGLPIEAIRQMDLKTDDGMPHSGKFGIVTTDLICGGNWGVVITSYPAPSSTCLAVGGKKID